MRAERLGSYSMAATFAGIPSFSRRKSIDRYFRACPPPRCHDVTSPCELRPPVRFFDSTSDFSGVCLVMSLLSSIVKKRREGVYGLYVLSAIIDCLLLYLRESRFAPVLRCITDSRRTRSSFRLRPAGRRLSSSRACDLRRGLGGETCRENSPCARDPLSP